MRRIYIAIMYSNDIYVKSVLAKSLSLIKKTIKTYPNVTDVRIEIHEVSDSESVFAGMLFFKHRGGKLYEV